MALGEIAPYIHKMDATIQARRDLRDVGNSETARLLQTSWVSRREGKKTRGIGDCLVEEGVEVAIAGASNDRVDIIKESQKALYLILVGWASYGISVQQGLQAVQLAIGESLAKEPVQPEPLPRLAQYAGVAVGRVGVAGSGRDRDLVIKRSAQAVVALHTLWEATNITPQEVGEAMLKNTPSSNGSKAV